MKRRAAHNLTQRLQKKKQQPSAGSHKALKAGIRTMPDRRLDDVAWLEEPAHPVSSEIGGRPQTSADGLTGVLSRKRFDELAYRDLAQAWLTRGCLSCAVIEIDEFSSITKSYGRRASERLPQQMISICTSFLRRAAYIAHIGDNKIAIMLPRTSLLNAFALAESLREKIAASTFQIAEQQIQLSVSVGIAEYDFPEGDLESLLDDITTPLLEAKLDGKNQVTCYFGDLIIRSNHFSEHSAPAVDCRVLLNGDHSRHA
jgi:diguanylate cyclase (GGDEF)-like protein